MSVTSTKVSKASSPAASSASTAGSPKSPSVAASSTIASAASPGVQEYDEEYYTRPEFVYGGPFIKVEEISPFLNTSTPINLQLQGTFKKSFAYYSLKERLPIILTKVIDYLSREGAKIKASNSATDDDVRSLIEYISKLKNDLMTNKRYEPLQVDTPEARRWNQYIQDVQNPYYFTNVWVFTECYVYRRLREGCELTKGLQNFDPFDEQKERAFAGSLEAMCAVAERAAAMLPQSDRDKRKADFITLLKICLWSNKCDLSLSNGEQVCVGDGNSGNVIDPFQMIVDLKDKLLVDDSGKIYDSVTTKAANIAKAIEGQAAPTDEAPKDTPEQPAQPEEEAPKVPCPAKMTIPQFVMFDIVCDNSGYELFTDLCLAHFLISQKIVQKIRFHVKKIPWFVSDVTPRDFTFVINSCAQASYSREIAAPPTPEGAEGEEAATTAPARSVNSNSLKSLGEQWSRYLADGTFVLLSDDFWTSPHVYKDMKRYDPQLYRRLQFATALLFKGDLNYRKLLGERNCNSTLGFEAALQGFMPAPVIALRTVKADLICGLPKGKFEQLNKIDEKWMEKGDYGVIQFCAKAEPLKVSDRPCPDYGNTCYGVVCPQHEEL